jgi:hypothetical protein
MNVRGKGKNWSQSPRCCCTELVCIEMGLKHAGLNSDRMTPTLYLATLRLNPLDKVAAGNMPTAIIMATRLRKDAQHQITKKND